jgi:hypothetical protein
MEAAAAGIRALRRHSVAAERRSLRQFPDSSQLT